MSYSGDFNGQQQSQSATGGNEQGSNPVVEKMVQSIEVNTKTVADAVFAQRYSGGVRRQIILGMGELHENGLHVVQQVSILDALKNSGLKCATALEWPSNNIDLHIKEIFKQEATDKVGFLSMLGADVNSALRNRLSADTTPIRSANARLSRTMMHEFMDDNDIPAFCTDAPRDWELFLQNNRKSQHLNLVDPGVAKAVKEAMKLSNLPDDLTSLPPVDSLRQLGMLARNIYIMNEAERVLEEYPEIDVILVEAGRAHVTGNDTLKPEPSPYEHSMSSLVAGRSRHVFIGAPMYSSKEEMVANTSPQAMADPQILTLDYLDSTPFNTSWSRNSDLRESERLQALSPYLPFIRDTLRGRAPLELYAERKDELNNGLHDLRDKNGFARNFPNDYTPV